MQFDTVIQWCSDTLCSLIDRDRERAASVMQFSVLGRAAGFEGKWPVQLQYGDHHHRNRHCRQLLIKI